MKSERTFATFRVAGDGLDPDRLTKLLGVLPTKAYAKGQLYSGGPRSSNLKARTGVWLLSTDKKVHSDHLTDHINWLLDKILPRRTELRHFLEQNSLHAVMSCFWHGKHGTKPIVPREAIDMLKAIPASVEEDFDSDDETPIVPLNFRL